MSTDSNLEKLTNLLRELFQFDCADLDFGIYRIMNHKRDVLEKFISEDLPAKVAEELEKGAFAQQTRAATQLAELEEELRGLDSHAFDAEGDLSPAIAQLDKGKEYLRLKSETAGGRGREAIEASIYNHLVTFFSRYYQDGDFISKRRYSKRQKYAIPYNGEEVYLYWANHDQYYVKTGEYFTDYSYKDTHGTTVHFKLTAADVEQDNVKGDKRFFLPRPKEAAWDADRRELTIPFEYRPLTDQEQVRYGRTKQQEKINEETVARVPGQVKGPQEAVAALTAKRPRKDDPDDEPVSYLEHHLKQYTRRNTSDFFIHKDLKGFLSRELDFYLKNEVLNLDEMERAGEEAAEGWFQTMRVIKAIGLRIIEFLAQIENFQKMLWEKRKFVTETQYCITVGNIPEAFYDEIVACDAQWDEWKELFHIDEEAAALYGRGKARAANRRKFLQSHPTLVLDTRHYEREFVDRLLGTYDDLDEMTDGLLVNGENFQALQLLGTQYGKHVKCIYIDPPYNTQKDRFSYKDGYRSSSWLALMTDRLRLGRSLLRDDGVIWCSIDSNELYDLEMVMEQVFSHGNRLGDIVWRNARDNNPTRIATEHEYILCFARRIAETEQVWKNEFADPKEVLLAVYQDLKDNGLAPKEIQREIRRFIRDNKQLLAEVDRYKFVDEEGVYTGSQSVHNPHPGGYLYDVLHPETGKPMRLPANGYRFPEETMRRDYIEKDRLIYGPDENRIVQIKLYLRDYRDSLRSVVDLDGRLGAYALNALFGDGANLYENPKPPQLLDRLLSFSSTPGAVVVDFFAGSGATAQAVMEVQRRTEVPMRFVLIEMDRCFHDVILPRTKKVSFAASWKNGRPDVDPLPRSMLGVPRIVKYFRLESYEDSLGSIDLTSVNDQQKFAFDDYLFTYFLNWETRNCETVLDVSGLTRPFSYEVMVSQDGETATRPVDVPETFNYLIGLHARARRVHFDGDRRYLVYRGVVDNRQVAVIWRETEGWSKPDLERDRQFVLDQKLTEGADQIYVNGDSFIAGAKALEPVFKARMFAGVDL